MNIQQNSNKIFLSKFDFLLCFLQPAFRGSGGCDRMVVELDLQLPVQSVPITNEQFWVGLPLSGKVGGFLRVLWFPPPIILTATK